MVPVHAATALCQTDLEPIAGFVASALIAGDIDKSFKKRRAGSVAGKMLASDPVV
jgi:hypothetical protein